MALSLSHHDSHRALPDAILASLAGAVVLLLGPLAALVPRGLPMWAVLIILLSLVGLARRDALSRMKRELPGAAVVLAFLLLAVTSMAWSPSPRAGLTVAGIGSVALAALAGGAWLSALPAVEARRLANLFLAGTVVGIALFTSEAALGFPLNRWWNHIPADFPVAIANVPKRAEVLLCLLVWPAAMALDRRAGWSRRAPLLPVTYAIITLLLSSRSTMLGIAVGLLAFAVALWSKTLVRRALGATLTVAFVAVVPVVLLLNRMLDLNAAEWLFRSARHNVEAWGMAAERTLTAPFFGQGIDALRALDPEGGMSRFARITDSLLPLHPHNAFLQVWLELGVAGAALALLGSLLLLNGTKRLEEREQPFALALFASGLAMISTAYGIWQAWWMAEIVAAGLMLVMVARSPAGDH